jgi:ABC-type multidrug transport system ATPase subunit/ABC-type multidrug transport system permease subunit
VGNQVAEKPHAAPPLLVRTRRSDHRLDGGAEYRIGRDPAGDIVLDDARVSWRHAVLKVDGQSWVLEDLGSTNGTWLGPERTSRVSIRANCVVRLGNPEDGPVLRFEPQVQPGPAPAPAPAARPATPAAAVPAAQASMAHLPSVDRRPTARLPLPAKVMRIGRTPENDLIVSDLGVSRQHAELRKSQSGRYEIIDLGSHNGTFVNGSRVERAEVTEDDIISIGHATFRLTDDELREYVDEGDVSFEARDLRVKVQGDKILLDNVSFPIEERFLVGVIGPSGAGKSTLLNALTGMRPADTGTVLYDNRDLYKDYAELRHRIGLVPQKDIMHTQLTPRTALGYAAELRFPSDTHKTERTNRVEEVLGELSLTHRADVRAENLSGGQLKRVNVALELLTRPSLLFLDEPTSGLDPGLDAQVMEQMRDLAHDGRTIIVVTHSVENLNTCDRLLVLVPGGKIAYYGPPQDGLTYFGKPRWADVFRAFDGEPDRDWAGEFQRSKEFTRYVTNPMTPRPPQAQPPGQPGYDRQPAPVPPRRRGRIRQLSTLARRYLRVIAADRFYLGSIIALPIILGALVRLLSPSQGLAGAPGSNSGAQTMLMVLMIMACLAGVVNAVREIVKERSIYIRERAAGLSAGAYLASKVLVLGVIAVLQAVVMTAIGVLGHPLPPTGSFLTHAPLAELVLAVAFLELASTCLGLLVSTWVSSSDKAMQAIVLVTMIQFVFSGGIISLAGKPGLEQVAAIAPARWGMAALASTVRLNVLNPSMGAKPDPLWNHTASVWLLDMGLMLALSAVFLLLAWWKLNRLSPGRRK